MELKLSLGSRFQLASMETQPSAVIKATNFYCEIPEFRNKTQFSPSTQGINNTYGIKLTPPLSGRAI